MESGDKNKPVLEACRGLPVDLSIPLHPFLSSQLESQLDFYLLIYAQSWRSSTFFILLTSLLDALWTPFFMIGLSWIWQ